jgi:hypothetical protein
MATAATVFFPTDRSLLGAMTTLTAAVSAGATSLPVVSDEGLTTSNTFLLIGELGTEEAEIKQINGGTPPNVVGCILLSRAHPAGTPVYAISADNINVYGCATKDGTYVLVASGLPLGVGVPLGTFYTYSPVAYRYLKATYYQGVLNSESPIADAEVIDCYDKINYSSVGAYKTYAGITDASQDDDIALALRASSSTINAYLFGDASQSLWSTTYTERVPVPRRESDVLILNHSPIQSVTSIAVDGTTVYPGSVDIETTDGYLVYLNSPLARPSRGNRLNASVVYVAGYTSLPEDVTLACQKLTSNLLNKDTRDAAGIRSYSIGTKRVEYDTSATTLANASAIPPSVQSLLAPYRSSLIHRYQ